MSANHYKKFTLFHVNSFSCYRFQRGNKKQEVIPKFHFLIATKTFMEHAYAFFFFVTLQ